MISCTDFIPAYSELFKYIEQKGGKQAVVDYWKYLSDKFLDNLRELVKEKGLRGCWEYWSHTLNEEAADFTMELDEEKGFFRIDMRYCPSKGRLNTIEHVEPYRDYCEHCVCLYPPVLEKFGFECEMDMSQCDKAKCSIVIRPKKK